MSDMDSSMRGNKVSASSSKMTKFLKKGTFTKVAAVFTNRKAEPKAEPQESESKKEPEERADLTVTIAGQPTETIAPPEITTIPSLSDKLRNQLKVIKKRSGEKPVTIDPRQGNTYCEGCRNLRSVAHVPGEDKDREFHNFTEVTDGDMKDWEWWVDSDFYKKYTSCSRCEKNWDEGCDICGQLLSHRAPPEYYSQHFDPNKNSSCMVRSHPQCALAYYENEYGPSTKWFAGENDCVYGSKMSGGQNKIIDRCICGEKLGSEKIMQTLSWALRERM